MSITDELREWAQKAPTYAFMQKLPTLADRIDDQFDRICQQQENVLQATIDMIGEGYVELPKDAKGEYIHIGDMMHVSYQKAPKEVAGFGVLEGEPFVVWYDVGLIKGTKALTLKEGGGGWDYIGHVNARHVKQPTVEDILEELSDALDDAKIPGGSEKRTYSEIIAEYAAKLQLKEES